MMTGRRPSTALAIALYAALWIPSVLIAGFISFFGFIGMGFDPSWYALTSLSALPFVLVGIASFRFSAALIVLSLCLHVVSATWPRVIVTAFFKGGSTMDTLLASAAAVLVLVAGLSPFPSMIHFFRYERDH
jgi:hypothetical protein